MDLTDHSRRRDYHYKNVAKEFFCPLCGSKRAFTIGPKMKPIQHVQVLILTGILAAFLFPLMKWNAFFIYFPIWVCFEGARRILFRREVPCPHCGFDASWYKRDIKVARKLVEEFWAKKEAPKADPSQMPEDASPLVKDSESQENETPFFQ